MRLLFIFFDCRLRPAATTRLTGKGSALPVSQQTGTRVSELCDLHGGQRRIQPAPTLPARRAGAPGFLVEFMPYPATILVRIEPPAHILNKKASSVCSWRKTSSLVTAPPPMSDLGAATVAVHPAAQRTGKCEDRNERPGKDSAWPRESGCIVKDSQSGFRASSSSSSYSDGSPGRGQATASSMVGSLALSCASTAESEGVASPYALRHGAVDSFDAAATVDASAFVGSPKSSPKAGNPEIVLLDKAASYPMSPNRAVSGRRVCPRKLWQPDNQADVCSMQSCDVIFGSAMFGGSRRHHCRQCGRVVCSDCSRGTVSLVLPMQLWSSSAPGMSAVPRHTCVPLSFLR